MNETLKEVKKILHDANIDEADVKARIILREVGHLSVEDMLLQKEVQNKNEVLEFAKKLAQTRAPIQHLLGYADFMGQKFKISPNVLIPRDETEIIVNCAIEKIKLLQAKNEGVTAILDIGTGCGCISCMIARQIENVEILGLDISTDALMVALENTMKMDLVKKVVFRKSDLFGALREGEKFDIVVSNPPYIPKSELKNLDDEVKNFEPHLALFADGNGMEFYKKIIKDAANYVNFGGYIVFETGINQAREICILLERSGFQVSDVIKDLAGISRCVAARMVLANSELPL